MLRRTPLRRTTYIRRTTFARARSITTPALKREAMNPEVRKAVGERTGRCERCGTGLRALWECHHRKLRSREGSKGRAGDTLPNLLALCRACHVWVHGNPAAATALGYMVPSWADPARWPVVLRFDASRPISGGVWGIPDHLGAWSIVGGPSPEQADLVAALLSTPNDPRCT